MPSRGKKRSYAAAALAQPGDSEQDKHDAAVPPPDVDHQVVARPSPRRSSRRAGTVSTRPDRAAALFPLQSDINEVKEKSMSQKETHKVLDAQKKGAQVVVDNTMQSLEALELALKKDIKRRKLQVQSSFISEEENKIPLYPRMRRGESVTLPPDRLLLTPNRDTDPGATVSDPLQGIIEAERDANDDVVENVDRGAKRAPAVNSAYLPLPIKGRLGYVGPPILT